MSNVTPFIQRIKGNTIVTFQSSYEDLNLNINQSSGAKFKFSNFALLNLPNIERTNQKNKNSIQLDNIEGKFTYGNSQENSPTNDIIDFSESIQNYLLNIESLLISNESYNKGNPKNVSQRIFFKWLKELGAIRFESHKTINGVKKYLEEKESINEDKDDYSRVVQYIGTIDMTGSNFTNNINGTKELYLYVPSQNGNTPDIMFNSISDENYNPGMVIWRTSGDLEFINGRSESDDPTPVGLSSQALYDCDVPFGSYVYTSNSTSNLVWFKDLQQSSINAYYTDEQFDDPSNDLITRSNPNNQRSITYKRSKLDGIEIDFNVNNYTSLSTNNSIQSFNDINGSKNSTDFKYNAVALFYDIEDENTGTISTNLYGLIFLDDIESVGTGSTSFKRNTKYRSNTVLGHNGNGIGIRVNIKLSNDFRTTIPRYEVSVNDYNTFSMEIFERAIQELITMNINCNKLMEDNLYLKKVNDDLSSVISEYLIQNGDLTKNYQTIKEYFEKYVTDIGINETVSEINRKISGIPNTKIDYKSINDGMLGSNIITKFNTDTYTKSLTSNNFNINNRYIIHDNNGLEISSDNDVIIYLSDKNGWKVNQLITIIFKDDIIFNGNKLVIYTDENSKFGTSKFSKLIYMNEIENKISKIDIICIDNKQYKFIVHDYL